MFDKVTRGSARSWFEFKLRWNVTGHVSSHYQPVGRAQPTTGQTGQEQRRRASTSIFVR